MNKYGMPDNVPYWIIDGYYYQLDIKNLDNSIVKKISGEELVSITDNNEYDVALDKIKEKLHYGCKREGL